MSASANNNTNNINAVKSNTSKNNKEILPENKENLAPEIEKWEELLRLNQEREMREQNEAKFKFRQEQSKFRPIGWTNTPQNRAAEKIYYQKEIERSRRYRAND